jgi:hypothetical protein
MVSMVSMVDGVYVCGMGMCINVSMGVWCVLWWYCSAWIL